LKRSLTPADGAWWWMEHPTNLMTITAVFTFAEPFAPDPHAMIAAFHESFAELQTAHAVHPEHTTTMDTPLPTLFA
jgi:hypothetical protein